MTDAAMPVSSSVTSPLHRYLNEFDYRYSNRERLGIDDKTRANLAVRNAKGRRLTYERLG